MAKKIDYNVKTGLEYELAFGTVNIPISPETFGKFEEALGKLDELKSKYALGSSVDVAAAEKEARVLFDEVFGAGFCAAAFGTNSLFAVNSSGEYLFVEFFNAFFPEFEKDLKTSAGKINNSSTISPAAEKYLADIPDKTDALDLSNLNRDQKRKLLQLLEG